MKCPKCGSKCEAEFVDIGVGEQQCTPYHCTNEKCDWIESYEDFNIDQLLEKLDD